MTNTMATPGLSAVRATKAVRSAITLITTAVVETASTGRCSVMYNASPDRVQSVAQRPRQEIIKTTQ